MVLDALIKIKNEIDSTLTFRTFPFQNPVLEAYVQGEGKRLGMLPGAGGTP